MKTATFQITGEGFRFTRYEKGEFVKYKQGDTIVLDEQEAFKLNANVTRTSEWAEKKSGTPERLTVNATATNTSPTPQPVLATPPTTDTPTTKK